MPKLVITQDGEAREVALTSGDVLGRSAQNAIPLKVAEASRRHCRFAEEQGSWFVEDMGSSNGTQVNGRKVSKFELQDGDVISVGAVELRFLDLEVEESAEPEVEWGDDEISLEDDVFLVIGGARRDGEVVTVPEGTLSVGRHAKHMLVLKDKSVSGDHAEIVREGSTYTLRDLGSSNGTYVEGRKVTEAELQSGDVVRFGAVPCTFGIGDPAAFSAPKELIDAGDQASHAFTRVMQVDGDLDDDPGFALSGEIPKQKETVWNVVAVVMLVGLGAAAWFFLNWTPGGAGGPVGSGNPSGNLVPALAWSFELPEFEDETTETPAELLWDVEDGDDGSASLVNDPVLEGSFACRVERSVDGGVATLATLQQELPVAPKQAYILSATCIDAEGTPCIGVVWLAQDTDPDGKTIHVPFARDIVRGEPAANDDWFEITGIVVAPPGASRARFGVGLTEQGGATFDQVSMVFTGVPEGRSAEHGGFISNLGRQGDVRVSRYGHRIIEGMGLDLTQDGRSFEQASLLVVNPSGPAGSVSGSIAGGRGDLTVSQKTEGEKLVVSFDGTALKQAGALRLPLVARGDSGINVTVLSGDRGVRHLQPFEGVEADALIMGGGAHRVRVGFTAGGKAIPVKASFARPKRALPVVRLETGALEAITLSFQVDFAAEEQAARRLLAQAKEAERHQKSGEAMRLCEEVMARYPFEENAEAEAGSLHGRLLQAGRAKTTELTGRLEDAMFFRDLLRDQDLENDIQAEVARYTGTSLADALTALHTRFIDTRTAWDLPRRQRDAERAFLRAKDYMDGEKKQLALLFFKTIVKDYPDTDEADQSAAYIKRLESSSGGGQH